MKERAKDEHRASEGFREISLTRPNLDYLPYHTEIAEMALQLWEISAYCWMPTPEFIDENWEWIQQILKLHNLKKFHADNLLGAPL